MNRTPRPRKTAKLSDSVHQQVNMYALAAGAAGVSLLALAPLAEAKIVYTPAHAVIGHGGAPYVAIDLNHDGLADLAVATSHNSCTSTCLVNLGAFPLGNEIKGTKFSSHSTSVFVAWALRPEARVGPHAPFIRGGNFGCEMLDVFSFPSMHYRKFTGHWHDVKNRYLGVKFSVDGETHFGWVRLSVHDQGHAITAVLTGYAYETVPNKAILAGKTEEPDEMSATTPTPATLGTLEPMPAMLGLLALGAPGLSIWRREESMAAAPEGN
jgi:hypothetical protein